MNDTIYSGAKLGFLGTGNMGGALARAARKNVPAACVHLANRTPEKARALDLQCPVTDNQEIAAWANYLFLGVKPQMMPDLLGELASTLAMRAEALGASPSRHSRFLLVTMAAGLSIARIQELAGGSYPVIRIMPNTPASIGAGMVLYTCSPEVTEEDLQIFLEAMSGAGRFSPVPETLMDAGSAVSGCGPAFVDLFIEALADGGVACGLPRLLALELAAQMTAGAAQLVLESGRHPGALKDAVCSPGGTTIQGVRALEKAGFRSAVMEAVLAAYEKSCDLKA